MESAEVDELLSIFNVSASGGLTKQEFVFCWAEWIKKATQTILQQPYISHCCRWRGRARRWWWWMSRMTSSRAASPSSTVPPARTGRT